MRHALILVSFIKIVNRNPSSIDIALIGILHQSAFFKAAFSIVAFGHCLSFLT